MEEFMDKYLYLILLALALLWFPVYANIESYETDCITIKFNIDISPQLVNNIVITSIPEIDSLNTTYHANGFKYFNFSWSTRIKNVMFLFFDPFYAPDVESLTHKYQIAAEGFSYYVEYICKPEVNFVPGEYLYSSSMYNDEDTIWQMYNENDDKRNWRLFSHFQYYHNNIWNWNDDAALLHENYYGSFNQVEVNEINRPFPYRWAYHGHSSLWHHQENYNNTYTAWDYSRGEGTTSWISDPHGFWTGHPDLVNQWHPNYQTIDNNQTSPPTYLTPFTYLQNYWKYVYHGTVCAGALAAGLETSYESNLSNMSSVGVAPLTKIIGTYYSDLLNFVDYLHNHQELNVRALSISYNISYNQTYLLAFQDLIDMGVTITLSRSYGSNLCDIPLYGNLDGCISVGDYRPDFRVKTFFGNYTTPNNYNSDPNYYKVEINAPGWNIWVPGFYHEYPDFQQVGFSLDYGSNTSIATPQVAGVVSLVSSLYPWMTPEQIERQIKLGAHHLSDMINANSSFLPMTPPIFFGAGCLNAYGSMFLHGDFYRNFVFSNEANNTALLGKDFELVNSRMTINDGFLRIEKDADVHFTNSSLTIADNVTVILESFSKITLDQDSHIFIGNNVTFTNENNDPVYGVFINGVNQISLNNCSFVNCDLNIEYGSLEALNSSFVNSAINCYRTIVSITDCPQLGGVYCNGSEFVEIRNNTENTYSITGMYDGVTLINCGETYVYGYNITNNARHGVNLHESYGHNTIEICTIISNYSDGVRLYHSNARIIGCIISGNNKGIIAYRGSNIEIYKDPSTAPWLHDSCISNNTWIEILFTDDCDLQMANGMNKVLDAPYDPSTFDRFLVNCPNMTRSRDLRYNFWGSDQWDNPIYPSSDRFNPPIINPFDNEIGFYLEPLWNPGPPTIITWENDELFYHNAIDLALADNIEGAIYLFKELISQYPGSDYAPAAAKNLLALEEDKQALKDYYATEPNLHWNGEINKLADYLENYCNIKMGDYQAAIAWFEAVISDPQSELDSLMAVIDLGYVYLLMQENPPKSSITCLYPQFAPKSRAEYERQTDALLSALYYPTDDPDQDGNGNDIPLIVQYPVLNNNYPNPFNPSTTISYSLPKEMHCTLSVYNIKGQKVKTLFDGKSLKGNQRLVWNGMDDNSKHVASGVYFYKLVTPDKSITKKMILMK